MQKRNCPELIYLLTSYNYIDAATNVTVDLIDAILGRGSDLFNLTVTLNTYQQLNPIYIPHNQIHNLLCLLDDAKKNDTEMNSLHSLLNQKVQLLQNTLANESNIS